MFLSVIIPVYNSEKYLSECLDSLLEQDLPKNSYEIICINDGSTDSSLDILKSYGSRYSNIIISDQSNKGVCQARNAGLKIAQGEYVWFVDADDFIQDSVLSRLKNIIDQSSCDMLTVGCYTFFEALSEQEKDLKKHHQIKENMFGNDSYVTNHLLRRAFLYNHKLSFIHPELKFYEDSVFICEVKMAKPHRMRADGVIYFYRRNSGSATMKPGQSFKMGVEQALTAAHIMKKYYDNGNKEEYIANLWMFSLWSGLHKLSLLKQAEIDEELRRLKLNKDWPIKRPKECTQKKSYITSRNDLYGKLSDWIFMHSNTVMGFKILRLFSALRMLVKRSEY